MVSIISALLGFIVLILAELRYILISRQGLEKSNAVSQLWGIPWHKSLQAIGYIFVAAGMTCIVLGSVPDMNLPDFIRIIFLVLAFAGGIFLLWTVFLEIPIGIKKYRVPASHAYVHGSYSKCRHPGFWFFCTFSLGIGLWSNNYLVLFIFFTLNLLNLLLILLQDKYTFPLQFVDYREYAEQVPFLLPHRRKRQR